MDDVSYYRGIDYLGIYDINGKPKKIAKELSIINKRIKRSLFSEMKLRLLYLVNSIGIIGTDIEVGIEPEFSSKYLEERY